MQAILPAVVKGQKSGKYTRDNTKCMVEEGGVVSIGCVVTQFSALGLSRQEIAVRYEEGKLKRNPEESYYGDLKVEYIENSVCGKTNNIFSPEWQKISCTKKPCFCQKESSLRKIWSEDAALQVYSCMRPSNAYLGATECRCLIEFAELKDFGK